MNREGALKLLEGGPDGIAEWHRRREALEKAPDLSGAILAWADLREADLRGADLRGANLRDTNLSEADLRGANLRKANLSGANFSGAKLSEVKLSGANLRWANLSEANLSGADLTWADFFRAKLIEANFRGADLSPADLSLADVRGANFTEANLSGAGLERANLGGANLGRANLSGADLTKAFCDGTAFENVDLSEIKGLDSVNHLGPSTIGIDTLFRSKGKIPEVFLRGCGVPESVITNRFALIGALDPIQFYSCFISYSTKDKDFAERLHSKMRDQGLRVWFAPEDMQGGKKLREQVDEAIRVYDKLLVVLSPNSIDSKWVRDEIRRARKSEIRDGRRKLFPVRLMDYKGLEQWESFYADLAEDVAQEIRDYFIPDFSNWQDHDTFETSFARLLKDLKADKPSKS